MQTIHRIREAINDQKYRISLHANEEMSEDDIEINDIESIVLTGKIARKFTHDPRGTRYEIIGRTTDGRHGYVICRFLPSKVLLVVTAYVPE